MHHGYYHLTYQEVTQDEPINSANAPYIKGVLKNHIKDSDIVLAIAGIYASYSDWMEWEMSTAKDLEKPIVGIIPWGQKRISNTVFKYSIENVHWNTPSILDAILKYL